MSTNENAVSKVEAPEITTPYTESAQARLLELRSMRGLIPHFVIPTSRLDTVRLSSAASVPAEFIELTAVALTNETALVRGDGATPAEMRDMLSYAEAFGPFADELDALAHFVRHSVTVARNFAGVEALNTYALAQRLGKQRKTAHLAPYADAMRRALGRMRKLTPDAVAKKKAAKTATTPPAPPATPQPK
ncbi:MAG TPA: hypothetical protein VJW75_07565 [Candidatus Eisenbacteria bacterium]|nr:hypothetical protein [Candidatus Eisenbacteria bacterium]